MSGGERRTVSVEIALPPSGSVSGAAADIRAGLTKPFKEISPRYFYDDRGSQLFERITELPEYYPNRCERQILRDHSTEIAETTRASTLIELGSGSAAKSRVLLDAIRDAGTLRTYCPVDISEEITRETAEMIASEYDGVEVRGLVCDFEHDLERIPVGGPRLIALLGGTVGNLPPQQRSGFLRRVANLLDSEDYFLLGVDLIKDPATLVAAYDDPQGVTAEFNRNALRVLNDRFGGNFDPEAFEHVALWDPQNLWIEMRLRSLRDQRVRLEDLDLELDFSQGEEMRTEISTKFAREGLESIFAEADLELTGWFPSEGDEYALAIARSARRG